MTRHNTSTGTFDLNTSVALPDDADFSPIRGLFSSNGNTSMQLRNSFQRNSGKTRLRVLDRLGSGANGDVYNAELIFIRIDKPGVIPFSCAVKRLKNYDNGVVIPEEFMIQQEMTDDKEHHSSTESGVLTMIGVHTETAPDGTKIHYAVFPKCNAMLASWLPAMSALRNDEPDLFCHVGHGLFNSFFLGLKTFNHHEIFYGDAKPLNTGFRNDGFVFLDFGSAQKYKNFHESEKDVQGSPFYMAPEIAVGEKIDPFAADVFACGQMLRQLLGLDVLFKAETQGGFMFQAGTAYKSARAANPRNPLDDLKIQGQLCFKIAGAPNYISCLTIITNAMCEFLPERRPTLNTLGFANKMLLYYKEKLTSVEISDVSDFYADLMCGVTHRGPQIAVPLQNTFVEETFILEARIETSRPGASTPPPVETVAALRSPERNVVSPASSISNHSSRGPSAKPSPAKLPYFLCNLNSNTGKENKEEAQPALQL